MAVVGWVRAGTVDGMHAGQSKESWLRNRPDDNILKNSTVTDSHESDHHCIKCFSHYAFAIYRTVWNMANNDRPAFIVELSSISEFSPVEKANQCSDFLRTVLDKHAPPSLRKAIAHNSTPWFESIRYALYIARRERRQAERK